jgi:two-component system response regulator YesN
MKKGNISDRAAEYVVSRKDEELATLKVKAIAITLGVNPSYLSRKFKNDKDMTLNDFITGVKMQRSARLLSKRKKTSVVNLAEKTGFARSDYFVILFKNHFGIHPRKFGELKKSKYQPRDYN